MALLKPSRAFIAMTLVAASSAAFAQDLPRYDVAAHCAEVASFGGDHSAVLEKGCFAVEQESYDALKPKWPELPEAMRAHCGKVAEFGGGSYQMLKGCVDMETEASGENTFKY